MSGSAVATVDSRGFTVLKSKLTKTIQTRIKKELTLVPVSSFGNFDSKEIKVFQETPEYLTVPLYFARQSTLFKDFEEDVNFEPSSVLFEAENFTLRQGVQTDCYVKCMLEKEKSVGGGILNLATSTGKCLGVDTGIVMNDGTVKKVQDIIPGDVLLGEGKEPCTVKSVASGKDALFKISYDDGNFVCNSVHILCVKNDIKILENPDEGIPYTVSYFCPSSNRVRASICDSLRTALLKKIFLEEIIGVFDISLNDYIFSKCRLGLYRRTEPVNHWESNGKSLEECYSIGKSLDTVAINKIKIGNIQERKKILKGVLDGIVIGGVYSSYLEKILMFLQGSLGSKKSIPFTCSYLSYGTYYGFELTGNRRFVLEDFVITHNTVLGIKLISSFQMKSLIVVNKIQLMKQWTQELRDKLPGVKIGTIQGKTFNHEGCQVVIGMLQTLSMSKSITPDSLKSFGMCIIDEVHGIASEVFSKIMFKIRPKYLFGLTATLERKDKMEKMILWYIGDVLFSNSSELKQETDIRSIVYKGDSSKELLLRDGTPAVSSMISNISLDSERTVILIGIIKDLAKNKENQILVLSDRTAQLKNLHSKLPGISGLFIGSLKPEVLSVNKQAQVLLATYGMASEGFNVPRLNCLVFATPRSNITQSIGRIYRKNHDSPPIIVDIIDNFSIFSRQQYARKKIYKKNIKQNAGIEIVEEEIEEEVCLIEE
jgi:hypothetical protein